jgi:translation initiation factor IF-2
MDSTVKSDLMLRPPIVVILGHVDHGKTTLLDTIRKTDIATKEHGGITQHIGAYQIDIDTSIFSSKSYPIKKITFIDTPGHEAFSKMRERGANIADIAVLVIAANDGIKPQTLESLKHIKDAKIPYIVALNKTDLPDINADKIKQQLQKNDIKLEEYGGDIPLINVSAKKGTGVDKLLYTILLLADLYQIKEDKQNINEAVVIESNLSKNIGPTATIIMKNGKINIGDELFCENQSLKIRALINWKGNNITEIHPSEPAQVLGWKIIPKIGSIVTDKKHEITNKNNQPNTDKIITLESQSEEEEKIKLILKTDTNGSLEAIMAQLQKNLNLNVLHSAIGAINDSDVLLAKTTKSIIIGFNVKASNSTLKLAESEKIIIKTFNIIYELLDELNDVTEMLKEKNQEVILGEAKILVIFPQKNKENIAGVRIIKGEIKKGDKIKIIRNNEEIGRSRIISLKHGKDDIQKAKINTEAGLQLANHVEYLTGDSIISIGLN